jgi:hypothetical protein
MAECDRIVDGETLEDSVTGEAGFAYQVLDFGVLPFLILVRKFVYNA